MTMKGIGLKGSVFMAIKSRLPQKKKPKPKPKEYTCASCGKLKKATEYYKSYSKIHETTGKIPYCKDCLKDMIMDDTGTVQLDLVKRALQIIDRPFMWDLWLSAYEQKGDTFGFYIKNTAMQQYKHLTWKDSVFEPQEIVERNYDKSVKPIEFKLTEDIIDKWGAGYELKEYQAFERKYNFLKNNYPERTAMHTEALLNYIRYRVKEEFATANGNIKDAKEWGIMARDMATSAKINPSQLSKADLTDGLSTFGELVRAVEQAVDIIPILPTFKSRPHDKIDFTLWCYINYIRDLKGLPPCEYEEVYKFYDVRKQEYEQRVNKEENVFEDDENGELDG